MMAMLHTQASVRVVGGLKPVPLLVMVDTAHRIPYDQTYLRA